MKNPGWIGWLLLIVAAGAVVGCGGKGAGKSSLPAVGTSCPVQLPTSGAIALCIPLNDGITGTLAFTVAGLPTGVDVQIEPSTAETEPVSVRRSIKEATALQTWSIMVSDEAAGTNATIGGPIITLSGITTPASPSSVVVEMRDGNGAAAVYEFSRTTGTGISASSTYLPTSSQDAAQLLSGCLDADTTCFIAVVENSIFLPEPTPTFTEPEE